MGEYNICSIPDEFFEKNKNIIAWVMVVGEDHREIEYDIEIPIISTDKTGNDGETSEQINIVDQAITALNDAISALNEATERIEGAVVKIDTLAFSINNVGELDYSYEEGSEV